MKDALFVMHQKNWRGSEPEKSWRELETAIQESEYYRRSHPFDLAKRDTPELAGTHPGVVIWLLPANKDIPREARPLYFDEFLSWRRSARAITGQKSLEAAVGIPEPFQRGFNQLVAQLGNVDFSISPNANLTAPFSFSHFYNPNQTFNIEKGGTEAYALRVAGAFLKRYENSASEASPVPVSNAVVSVDSDLWDSAALKVARERYPGLKLKAVKEPPNFGSGLSIVYRLRENFDDVEVCRKALSEGHICVVSTRHLPVMNKQLTLLEQRPRQNLWTGLWTEAKRVIGKTRKSQKYLIVVHRGPEQNRVSRQGSCYECPDNPFVVWDCVWEEILRREETLNDKRQ